MQVLKEDVRNNIRLAAIKEFKEKGYEKSSMRIIATNAGISVGNLYRYFNNKQNLFDYIVDPVYNHIIKNLDCEFKMQFIDVNFLEYIDLIKSMVKTRKGNIEEFFILLEKSKGTKYENIKNTIISNFEDFINKQILNKINKDKEIVVGDMFAKAMAISLVEGISTIILEAKDEEEFIQNMVQYVELTFKSTVRTLFNIRDNKMKFRRLSDEEIYNTINSCNNY